MIRELIAAGKTSDAFRTLNHFIESVKEIEKAIIGNQARLYDAQRNQRLGVLKAEDYQIERSQVNNNLLEILQDLEEEIQEVYRRQNVKISEESFKEQLELKIAGKYKIVRTLGEGNTAIFYKAEEVGTDRFVAIRAMKKQDFTSSMLERTQGALQKIYNIKHRNIIKIIGVYLGDFPECILLEYVSGISLNRVLQSGPRSLREVISMTSQVGDALYYLHSKGIQTNKIRPAKILIDEENKPMISPFEIFSGSLNHSRLDKFIEELRYASPEEVKGGANDEKSDQFSLGLLAYEMSSGHPLFQGGALQEVIDHRELFFRSANHRKETFDALGLPSKFVYILKRLLNEEPDGRYPNIKEAIHQLTKVKLHLDEEVKIALESYQRCCTSNASFTEEFYDLLFEDYPELERYFQFKGPEQTVERRHKTRKKMLRSAITLLLESNEENNYLHRLADTEHHRGLKPPDFEKFIKTLIAMAARSDHMWNKKIQRCWEEVIHGNLKAMLPKEV
ncbi:MAG: protein kinase [Bacteroidota bacterium]